MATKPSVVWMVHARTGLQGVKGLLSLEGHELVFRPEDLRRGDTRLPLADVKKARRPPTSPVLELHLTTRTPGVVAFYFIRPPSLATPTTMLKVFSKYVARRRAVEELREGYALKKDEVDWWVETIHRALPA